MTFSTRETIAADPSPKEMAGQSRLASIAFSGHWWRPTRCAAHMSAALSPPQRISQMIEAARSLGARLNTSPVLLLTLAMLFWGGNTIAGRLAIGEVSPMVIVFLRWIIVAALMGMLMRGRLVEEWPLARPHRLGHRAVHLAVSFSACADLLHARGRTDRARARRCLHQSGADLLGHPRGGAARGAIPLASRGSAGACSWRDLALRAKERGSASVTPCPGTALDARNGSRLRSVSRISPKRTALRQCCRARARGNADGIRRSASCIHRSSSPLSRSC